MEMVNERGEDERVSRGLHFAVLGLDEFIMDKGRK